MPDNYMKMGASDRFFYYAMSGRSTINERIYLKFREEIDVALMKEAADEALKLIPEFNKRIVIKNGRLEALVGSGDVAFIPYKENGYVLLGSKETNDLLFYFGYGKKELTYSTFHGLTDAHGMKFYVQTVLYLYVKKKGMPLTGEEEAEVTKGLRTEEKPLDCSAEGDRLMPYETWGDVNAKPEWDHELSHAFAIPETRYPEECDYIHMCRIEASLDELDKVREKTGSSYLPFVCDLLSMSVAGTYECKDQPIVIMTAIDQRRGFGSNTLVNCSDSIFLESTPELRKADLVDRCSELKKMMKAQFEPALHRKMAGDKVQTVRGFEQMPEDCAVVAKRLEQMPPANNFNPMTLVLSFIGPMSMGTAIDRLLEDVIIYNSARASFVIIGFYGDKFHMTVGNMNDSSKFAQGIVSHMRECGIKADIVSDFHFYGDQFKYETIDRVE